MLPVAISELVEKREKSEWSVSGMVHLLDWVQKLQPRSICVPPPQKVSS